MLNRIIPRVVTPGLPASRCLRRERLDKVSAHKETVSPVKAKTYTPRFASGKIPDFLIPDC